MASIVKWSGGWTNRSTVLTTELNALADGSRTAVGTEIDNSSNLDQYGQVQLDVTFGTNPSTGARVDIYMVTAPDGTNYEDGAAATDPGAHKLVASIPIRATTSAQKLTSSPFPLLPAKSKFILLNKTGQAFPATGSTVKLFTCNDAVG